jgi:hypothetical protein
VARAPANEKEVEKMSREGKREIRKFTVENRCDV